MNNDEIQALWWKNTSGQVRINLKWASDPEEALEKILNEARDDERVKIGNELYDLMPTGEVNTFDLIKSINDYIKSLNVKSMSSNTRGKE